MKKVCAWCNKDMGEIEPFNDISVTHGICKECLQAKKAETNKMSEKNYSQFVADYTNMIDNKIHEIASRCKHDYDKLETVNPKDPNTVCITCSCGEVIEMPINEFVKMVVEH